MLSKRDKLFAAAAQLPVLTCPVCAAPLSADGAGFSCVSGHHCDVNRKGYLYCLRNAVDTYYDAELFTARSHVFAAGCYDAVADAISRALGDRTHRLLDAGCGDGWYLDRLLTDHPDWTGAGIDISRDAVTQAAGRDCTAVWCVGDLRRLPFADDSFTAVLDILTPAGYDEFRRVLTDDGILIKVYPGSGYLRELRQCRGMAPYEEGQVDAYLREQGHVLSTQLVTVSHPVDAALWRDFVWMTPLNQDLTAEEKNALAAAPMSTVTIDLHVTAIRL